MHPVARPLVQPPRWFVVAALLTLAALVRVSTLFYHDISGDDATVALMAAHILRGEGFPAFFYRQNYMGSLNGVHLVPALFVFGPSVWLVRLNSVAWSLIFPLGVYVLGRRLFDEATARLALLLTAVPPFLLTYWSTVAEPHFETNSFGVVLLLLALTARGAERGPRYSRILTVFGLTAGLAWWTNFKALEVILPATLVLWIRDPGLALRRAGVALAGGFVLGSLPVWIRYLTRDGAAAQGGELFEAGLDLSLHRLGRLLDTVLPSLLGAYYWEVDTPARRAALLVHVGVYAVAVALLVAEVLARRRYRVASVARDDGLWMLLLVIPASFGALYVSRYAGDFDRDTGRYVLPVYMSLFVGAGALATRVGRRSRTAGVTLVAFLLGFALWTNLAFLWPLDGEARAARAAQIAERQALVHHLAAHPVDALYVDDAYTSLRWAFLLDPVPVSELTTEVYLPNAVAADAGARVAILSERPDREFLGQLDMAGAAYRTTPFGPRLLVEDIRVPPHRYRLIPRTAWRVSGDRGAPPTVADGDLGTAWPPDGGLRGGPREVVVDLGAVQRVSRLIWWPSTTWEHSLPLVAAGSTDGRQWEPIATLPSAARRSLFVAGARPHFRPRNGWLEARRPPRLTRYLRFRPVEPPGREAWGIAELYAYEGDDQLRAPAEPDVALLIASLRARGVTRLLADAAISARVSRATGGRIQTLTANGALNSHGRTLPPARLADVVRLQPADGLLVPREDADDLRARLAVQALRFVDQLVGDYVLFSGLAPLEPPRPCQSTTWRVAAVAVDADGKSGRYVLDAWLRQPRRITAVRLEHPAVSIRHVPVPTVVASSDSRTWEQLTGVRRLVEHGWGGRTLFLFSTAAEELLVPVTTARQLRIELWLPYLGEHPVTRLCVRVG